MYRGICAPCCWWRKWCGAARMVPMQARREASFQCWWIRSPRLKTGLGLEKATAVQIGRALEDYEMLTKQELALWTRLKIGPPLIESSPDQNGTLSSSVGAEALGPPAPVAAAVGTPEASPLPSTN